jgi:hypothetical protein
MSREPLRKRQRMACSNLLKKKFKYLSHQIAAKIFPEIAPNSNVLKNHQGHKPLTEGLFLHMPSEGTSVLLQLL